MMMATWYDQIQRDVRLAGRRAARQSTFTVVVIVCLALGIGATAGVFSVLHPVLLNPVPFDDADRLVAIAAIDVNRTDPDERYWMSWVPAEDLRRSSRVLDGLGGFYRRDFDVLGTDGTERIAGSETVAGSFEALGVQPILGRTLREEDVLSGRRTALIGAALWDRRFGRDASVLGRTITLNERPHEIVGVLPEGISFPDRSEVWPAYQPQDYSESEQRGLGVLRIVGRLAEGRTEAELADELSAMLGRIQQIDPVFYDAWGFESIPLKQSLVGDFERPLWALFGGALLVLLLATANVANLLMARAQGEEWERALRTALGARCIRIAQQSLVENVLLAGVGALGGTFLAIWSVDALLAVTPLDNAAFDAVGLSAPVLLIAVAVAGMVAVAMSALPAARCYKALEILRGTRSGQAGRRERKLQTLFVVAQVALSLILLVGAGLLGRSFANLQSLDLGFETDGLLTVRVSAPASLTGSVEERFGFTLDVLERVAALPGVDAVGAVSWMPFEDGDVGFNHSIEDFPPESGGQRDLAPGWVVSPGYFEAMGIPVLTGRDFLPSDDRSAPEVAVVSRAFERRHWPTGSALGKRIKRGSYDLDRPWIEIVGVVGDIRSGTLSAAVQPAIYYTQGQRDGAYLAQLAYPIRTSLDAEAMVSAVRGAVAEVAPAATLYRVSTGRDISRVALGRPKFNGLVIGVFALIGLVLAGAGIYGVTAYTVGRRTHEFGLRVALGARPGQVRGLVLRQAVLVAAVGLALGIGVASLLARTLDEILFEVGSADAATYALVSAVLAGTVLLASFIPARRATRIEPTSALRDD